MDRDGPTDAELLAAGGWTRVRDALILAKDWDGDFCAAVVNTHGGDETNSHSTILECFERDPDGTWRSLGHDGSIARGDGHSGSHDGCNYEFGWSESDDSWWVIVLDESSSGHPPPST